MIREGPTHGRQLKSESLEFDLIVVGGGMAGTCCAITAARQGLKVALVQDRPVLGGNAGSEVRLWILGATSHMGNNNRWAREGGVIDEILVENTYRNPEGNPVVFDTVLLEKVIDEPNITLLLNTAVHEVTKHDADTIRAVRAFCSQTSTSYELSAPLFCDASGDGIVGFLSGAAFRMGAESREEFDEGFAPSEDYGHLLGHSIYFYVRDTGRPVQFVPPSYAHKDLGSVFRYRSFNLREHGCQLWWIEYGGRLDTVHDTEKIKWELWRVVYGIWGHVKNSGEFPEAENHTLEWVGLVPGKRESRRFEGDYMLRQQDVVEQRRHEDAVSFGGWALDLHPADGVFSEKPGCSQYHSRGVYQIPYRCMYSRNIRNLFLAGRIISASHVSFGSTRVMATCAHNAQAVGVAAALCREANVQPADLTASDRMGWLQRRLLQAGQYIPTVSLQDGDDLVRSATLHASSELQLAELARAGEPMLLREAWAMMLPLQPGAVPRCMLTADVSERTTLSAELRISERTGNHTPDVTVATREIPLEAGRDVPVDLAFDCEMPAEGYAFICLLRNPNVAIHTSDQHVTGVLAVTNRFNGRVASSNRQTPPPDSGLDSFEFWRPLRRPEGRNLSIRLEPPLQSFDVENVRNGIARPVGGPNAWVADRGDTKPSLSMHWSEPQQISRIELTFDTDMDHPMESVLMGHPERVMPFCVRSYRIRSGSQLLVDVRGNYQTRSTHVLPDPVLTRDLLIELDHPSDHVPAALFEIRCYEK